MGSSMLALNHWATPSAHLGFLMFSGQYGGMNGPHTLGNTTESHLQSFFTTSYFETGSSWLAQTGSETNFYAQD